MRKVWLCIFYALCIFTIVFSLFWMALPSLPFPADSGEETPASEPGLAAQGSAGQSGTDFYLCDEGGRVVVYTCSDNGLPDKRLLRTGIYLFAVMEWISAIGYRMFPLSDSGYAGAFQDVMHMVVTAAVVLLSIVSLSLIIAAGVRDRRCRSYGICAAIALGMMLVGAVGMKLVPAAYFGVVERFSVFAATGFNAVLGLHLFCGDAAEA